MRNRTEKYPLALRKSLADDYVATTIDGMPKYAYADLKKKYKVSEGTVSNIVREFGLKKRVPSRHIKKSNERCYLTPQQWQECLGCYKEGASLRSIAITYRCSASAVRRAILKVAGVKRLEDIRKKLVDGSQLFGKSVETANAALEKTNEELLAVEYGLTATALSNPAMEFIKTVNNILGKRGTVRSVTLTPNPGAGAIDVHVEIDVAHTDAVHIVV